MNKVVFRPQLRKIFKTEKVDRKSIVMMDVERAKRAHPSKDKMTKSQKKKGSIGKA